MKFHDRNIRAIKRKEKKCRKIQNGIFVVNVTFNFATNPDEIPRSQHTRYKNKLKEMQNNSKLNISSKCEIQFRHESR